jgi:hypothetical protein
MKYFTFLIGIVWLTLSSCSTDKRLDGYKRIVDDADKIVFYTRVADSFIVTSKVDSLEYLQNLKDIFQRNIKPEPQTKFIAQHKIELYNREQLTGVLLISGTTTGGLVNFINDQFSFGFKLTYGIGMSL